MGLARFDCKPQIIHVRIAVIHGKCKTLKWDC